MRKGSELPGRCQTGMHYPELWDALAYARKPVHEKYGGYLYDVPQLHAALQKFLEEGALPSADVALHTQRHLVLPSPGILAELCS